MGIEVYDRYTDIDEQKRAYIECAYLKGQEYSAEWLLFSEQYLMQYEPIYFVGIEGENVTGFATGFVVKKLNVANYFPPKVKKVFHFLDRLHLNPLHYKVIFIKHPLSYLDGIHVDADGGAEAFLNQMKQVIYKRKKFHSVFISNMEDERLSQHVLNAAFVKIPFYPNTALDTRYDHFDDYLKSLKKKKRWDIKNKMKTLRDYGAKIDIYRQGELSSDDFSRIFQLYENTVRKGQESFVDDSFQPKYAPQAFAHWQGAKWVLVRYEAEIIAFAVIVEENGVLLFKHVGMDYDHSVPSNAYFNLYYTAISYAIEQGITKMYCGPTTYEAKKSIGCKMVDVNSFISVKSALLQKIMSKVLKKAFGS